MDEIVNLDQTVLSALDFFISGRPPSFDISRFNLPLVVGSGNAFNTGKIIFSSKGCVFADESSFKMLINAYEDPVKEGLIKQAVVISASGGKDSVWELELAKEKGLETSLLTTKKDSEAAKIADKVYVYLSIDEPYTYNTSTYMGMILSATGENPVKIKEAVSRLQFPSGFENFKSYAFVLPDQFAHICPMIIQKRDELFGPHLLIRASSEGQARHAKFVIRSKEELVIGIGEKNEFFGDPQSRWDFPLEKGSGYAEIMALTYFIVGKIQASRPPYFKEHIKNFVSDYGPKAYGSEKPFDLIVPGSANTELLSEKALSADRNRPEEDEAWESLQEPTNDKD